MKPSRRAFRALQPSVSIALDDIEMSSCLALEGREGKAEGDSRIGEGSLEK
jgi:hypothetical protein